MKIAGQLMLPDAHQAVRLSPGVVEIAGQRIIRVTEGDIPEDADLGGPGCIICPGFVDAHVHLPQFGIIGAHGLGLLDWLDRVTFPAELAWADVDHARAQGEMAIRRMLAAGTTGFAAYATVHAPGARAALEVAEQLGVRAWIGQVLMDRNAPDGLTRPTDQLLAETAALLGDYPVGPRVAAAVTPRFAPTCSEALLAGAGRLAAQHGCLVQTHLAETPAECDWVSQLFAGRSYVQVYEEAGLLGARTVLGHGIYIEDADRRALAQAKATIAHCPTANRFLMSGRLDWSVARGYPFALSSDIGGGYEVSMPRVAREMISTAGELRIDDPTRAVDTLPTAARAWWQITAGNAAALGWADGGRIEPGCAADLLVLRPGIDWPANPVHNPLAMLLWAWDDRWLERVVLAGGVYAP